MTDAGKINTNPKAIAAIVANLRDGQVLPSSGRSSLAAFLEALSAERGQLSARLAACERERDEARAENVWRPFNDDTPKDGVWLCVPWGPVYVSAFFGTATDVEGGETPAWRTHWDHSNLETDWGPIEEWRWRPLPPPPTEPENMNLHTNPQPDATALIRPDPHVSVFKTTGRDSLVVRAGTIFAGHMFAHDTSVPLHLNAAGEPGYVPGADYVVNCDCGALSVARPIGIPEGGTLLGGFHYAPGGNAPARSGGDDVPAINPFSLWDVGFRPACADPRGMTLVTTPSGRFWCDIYLTGMTHHYGTSKFGVIIATGYDTPRDAKGKPAERLDYATAQAVMAAHGKGLLSLEEFFAAAFGVTERTTADRAPKTTGLDAPRTSHFGLMQATGNLWVWGHDGDPDRPRAAILGGAWVSDGDAGSRFSDIGLWVADSGDSLGARGRCDCL